MKVKSVKCVGKKEVYDISVQDVEHYVLKNGVVTHNTGVMYAANTVLILGKSQEKDGTELVGYNFTINVEKSRFVKEKSKIPLVVTYKGGIDYYSGLHELALEGNFIAKTKVGWYAIVNQTTGEVSDKNFREKDFCLPEIGGEIIKNPKFNEFLKSKYCLKKGEKNSTDDFDDGIELSEEEINIDLK